MTSLYEVLSANSPAHSIKYKYKYNKGLRSETGQPLDK